MAYGNVKYAEPGSGTDVRFDDDGAGSKMQAVKLIDGTAGSTTPVGTSTNPIRTDPVGTTTQPVTAVGTVADDGTTPGSPVMIGGVAKETDGTDPGSVSAENDVARLVTDRNRRLLVSDVHPNLWRANENQATAQTNNELKAAPGAGLSLYITDLIISNGATAGSVKLVEDTAGTPVDLVGPLYLTANAGVAKQFKTPLRVSANKNLGFTSVSVTTHTVTVIGYIAP